MAKVGIITDEGQPTQTEIFSKEATIQADNFGQFSPSVVQNIKYDNKGQMSSITTECGETENRRQGNQKAKITVDGIIGESEIEQMRALKNREEIRFASDIIQTRVIVERVSIAQKADLNWIELGGEQELAFSFQVQLKEP